MIAKKRREFKGPLPNTVQLKLLLKQEKQRLQYQRILMNTIGTLISVAAVAVLIATFCMPVLRIYGASMAPTLNEGEIALSVKTSEFENGDVIAFYYNNKILVKRLIGKPGEWINIEKDGTVLINNQKMEEPYLSEKAFGDCNIELPYQVPEGKYFVMGDYRATSVDSRNSVIGCVAEEQIVGKIVFTLWPIRHLGWLS